MKRKSQNKVTLLPQIQLRELKTFYAKITLAKHRPTTPQSPKPLSAPHSQIIGPGKGPCKKSALLLGPLHHGMRPFQRATMLLHVCVRAAEHSGAGSLGLVGKVYVPWDAWGHTMD